MVEDTGGLELSESFEERSTGSRPAPRGQERMVFSMIEAMTASVAQRAAGVGSGVR